MRRPGRGRAAVLAVLAGLAALAAAAGPVRAAPPTAPVAVTPDLEVLPLADGVWRHRSWRRLESGTRVSSNGLLVRDGDRLLLVDTAWGDTLTEALLAWADTAMAWPVTAAIGTHAHDDRVGGARVLARRGIPLYVSPATHLRLSLDDARHATLIMDLRGAGASARLGPLELFAMGPAHAPDNIAVWLPRARVLFGGCAVRPSDSRTLGNVADADTLRWGESLFRLTQRYGRARVVVPGHGEPGGPELLSHTRSLLPRVPIEP